MVPVKVNIFISYAPEDRAQLNVLRRWLYPMIDEVNLWYNNPPRNAPALPIPWQILLFWYSPPDLRSRYYNVFRRQRENAHIYLFLTSYKSLSDRNIEDDIDVAARRHIEGDDFTGPFVFPLILTPSRWKEESRLAGFKPMAKGIPMTSYKQPDEGYLAVTEEISELIKVLQARLGEAKFYQSRLVTADGESTTAVKKARPYLGESPELFEFEETLPFQPAEWLGWSIILFLFVSIVGSLMPSRVLGPSRYENVKSANDHGREFIRENPLMPPKDSIPFPPAD